MLLVILVRHENTCFLNYLFVDLMRYHNLSLHLCTYELSASICLSIHLSVYYGIRYKWHHRTYFVINMFTTLCYITSDCFGLQCIVLHHVTYVHANQCITNITIMPWLVVTHWSHHHQLESHHNIIIFYNKPFDSPLLIITCRLPKATLLAISIHHGRKPGWTMNWPQRTSNHCSCLANTIRATSLIRPRSAAVLVTVITRSTRSTSASSGQAARWS